MNVQPTSPAAGNPNRRTVLAAGGAALAGAALAASLRPRLHAKTSVFIARSQHYGANLADAIRRGLTACGLAESTFRDKRVLLKPNLVEPARRLPHMTTHPAVIVAAAEVFAGWGAAVTVGEAPGHVRDTQLALDESGVGAALQDGGFGFADLNYEDVAWRRNRGGFSRLKGLYFPQSVIEADFLVSLPKLKTHHWVGLTAGMKNLYGVLPGLKYGWPKNVLHHNGIPQTVVDINCSVPRTLGIVDAIDCMEGDGPILGGVKAMGLLLISENLVALDATAARIMGLEPARVSYLGMASRALGPIDDSLIEQRGEQWQSVACPFRLVDKPHLQELRSDHHGTWFS